MFSANSKQCRCQPLNTWLLVALLRGLLMREREEGSNTEYTLSDSLLASLDEGVVTCSLPPSPPPLFGRLWLFCGNSFLIDCRVCLLQYSYLGALERGITNIPINSIHLQNRTILYFSINASTKRVTHSLTAANTNAIKALRTGSGLVRKLGNRNISTFTFPYDRIAPFFFATYPLSREQAVRYCLCANRDISLMRVHFG